MAPPRATLQQIRWYRACPPATPRPQATPRQARRPRPHKRPVFLKSKPRRFPAACLDPQLPGVERLSPKSSFRHSLNSSIPARRLPRISRLLRKYRMSRSFPRLSMESRGGHNRTCPFPPSGVGPLRTCISRIIRWFSHRSASSRGTQPLSDRSDISRCRSRGGPSTQAIRSLRSNSRRQPRAPRKRQALQTSPSF